MPAFIRWDSEKSDFNEINPPKNNPEIIEPETIGDSWTDVLEKEDKILIENYFKKMEHLKKNLEK